MLLFWVRMKINELGIHLKRIYYNEMVNMENKFNKIKFYNIKSKFTAHIQHKSKLATVMENRLKYLKGSAY